MRLLLWDLGNRFSLLCCQKASCVAWDKLLLCPSILILRVQSSSSSSASQECLGYAGLTWPGVVLMWGTELPWAGRERLKTLPKLKSRGKLQAGGGKPEEDNGKKVLTGNLWCHLEKASP